MQWWSFRRKLQHFPGQNAECHEIYQSIKLSSRQTFKLTPPEHKARVSPLKIPEVGTLWKEVFVNRVKM
jgi:hypothetical protein